MPDRELVNRQRATAFVVVVAAILLGLLTGALASWIANRMITSHDIKWLVDGASLLMLGVTFTKDFLVTLIDFFKQILSGRNLEIQMLSTIITLVIVSFLFSTALGLLLLSSKEESCEERIGAATKKIKCLSKTSDKLKSEVGNLSKSIKKLDAEIVQRVASCPLLFENAGLDAESSSLDGKGVCPTPRHIARLRGTVAYLAKRCEGASDTPCLWLKITGHYSGAEFRGVDHSDALNERAARLRADTVAAVLKVLLEDAKVEAGICMEYQKQDGEMQPPEFRDGDALAQKDRWLIGRSVFVRVVDPSSCGPPEGTRAASNPALRDGAAPPGPAGM